MTRKHSFTAVDLLPSKVYCCQALLLSYKTKKRGSLGNGLLFWHCRERQSRLRAVSYFSCVCSRFKSTRERRAAKPRGTRAERGCRSCGPEERKTTARGLASKWPDCKTVIDFFFSKLLVGKRLI